MTQKQFDGLGRVSSARFSPCRTWRYTLTRTWDLSRPGIAFVGLNPSTADEKENDPTIRRVIDFAKCWGYGEVVMLNLFAFLSTDPKGLHTAIDPVGPENDKWIKAVVTYSQAVCVAWGAHCHPLIKSRGDLVLWMIPAPRCLGTTKGGSPRHPLYVPGTHPLVDYPLESPPTKAGDA